MTDGHTRIINWLHQIMVGPDLPDRIIIRHLTIDDRQSDISAIGLHGFVANDEAFAALADDIATTIHSDASGFGGVQRYLVVACLGEALVSRLPVKQMASEIRNGDSVDSEPATPHGLLAQLMRHNEAQARLFSSAMGQIVSTMGETIERQKGDIDKADAIRVEALETIEGLISQKHEREMEILKEKGRTRRQESLVGLAMGLLPVVVNRVAGKKIFDESSASPIKGLLKKFVDSLTDEQKLKLRGILEMPQIIALQHLLAVTGGDEAAGTAAKATPVTTGAEGPSEGEAESDAEDGSAKKGEAS